LCMHVATLDYDDYLGYVAVGRITDGKIKMGDRILCAHRDGKREEFRVQKVLASQGLKRFEIAEGVAGDIVAVTGMAELNVGETLTDIQQPKILPLMTIDEPTISMQFIANDGPFAGQEGKYVTTRNIRERLFKELKSNVALRVEDTEQPNIFKVSGRGELHLSVLIETMRREGYELCVSQPEVIFKVVDGKKQEPYEEVIVDVDEQFAGAVIEKLGSRGGRMTEMAPAGTGRVRVEYLCPSRGLIGYRSEFLTDTRGTGVLNHTFAQYGDYAGAMKGRPAGALIAQEQGESNAYGMFKLQDRGQFFIKDQVKIYGGQIVGVHTRENDLIVNPCKVKQLNNIRTHAADEKLTLTPPLSLTLEEALEFINDDELVEVTPKAIRLRKRILDHNLRKASEKRQGIGQFAAFEA
jgi:GTP-binding protein